MVFQSEITYKMRQTLFLWLVQVQQEFQLKQDTLYLAINIIDRVSSTAHIPKIHYQLLGLSSLWVASKYEENHGYVPLLKRLCSVCNHTYNKAQIIWSENFILKEIGFSLGHVSSLHFLTAYSEQDTIPNNREMGLARYILEISILYECFIGIKSSVIARASMYLARFIMNENHVIPQKAEIQTCVNHLHCYLDQVPKLIYAKVFKINKFETAEYFHASRIVAQYCSTKKRWNGMQTPPKEQYPHYYYSIHYEDQSELNQTLSECLHYPEMFSKLLSERWGF